MKRASVMGRGMRVVCCVAIATAMIGVSGCSGKPSARDCRRVVENIAAKQGNFTVKNFKKVNATMSSMFGQEVYTVQCTWDQVYLRDTPAGMLQQARKKGEVVHTPDGGLVFRKTENGWEGMDGKIY